MKRGSRLSRGLTLVELLVTVAVASLLVVFAAPSLVDFIAVQRLKGVTGELVTDLQYARSEATSRGQVVRIRFKSPGGTYADSCYIIYSQAVGADNQCDCSLAPGSRCTAPSLEIKTVEVKASTAVRLTFSDVDGSEFPFSPVSGQRWFPISDAPPPIPAGYTVNAVMDSARTLRVVIASSGRPTVCRPSGSTVSGGYPAC